MQASSDPLDPHAVLGAVKARLGNAGASCKPSATAGLDRLSLSETQSRWQLISNRAMLLPYARGL
jgi:hypothetical protein